MEYLTSVSVSQGFRPYMEDTFIVNEMPELGKGTRLLCVFDGHGGDKVAELCKAKFTSLVQRHVRIFPDIPICIRRCFDEMDEIAKTMPKTMGSTALVCFIHRGRIWMANCGDAMGMVVLKNGSAVFMSKDHKVENEKERIMKAGGKITYDDGCARINRMLNIGRSIGDYHLKQYVIPTPFITSTLVDKVDYIVLASDGVWDVYNVETLHTDIENLKGQFLRAGLSMKEVVDQIGAEIVKKCYQKGSTDNITLILCFSQ